MILFEVEPEYDVGAHAEGAFVAGGVPVVLMGTGAGTGAGVEVDADAAGAD